MTDPTAAFPLALLIIAALYAAVGQAGATGYLAAMGARLLPERWLRLLLGAILLASGLRMLWPRA